MREGRAGRGRRWLLGLAVSLVSVLLCLGAIELAARALVAAQMPDPDQEPLHRHDPNLGWVKVPGAVAHLSREEFQITIQVNAQGQRGPLRPYQKPPGVRRVLLLGDSFAAGYYVEEEESVRAVLEQLLSCPSEPVEVLTAGTVGYSTDQELLEFERESWRYQPDLVVLLFYSNDLFYNGQSIGMARQPKPVFVLDRGELRLENVPAPEREATPPRPPPPFRGSMALRLLSQRTARSAPRLYRAVERLGLFPPLSTSPPREYRVYGPPRFAPEITPLWDLTGALIERLSQEVRARGAGFAVLYVPTRFEVNDEAWRLTCERYGMGRLWRRRAVIDELRRVCDRLGLDLLDPTEALRRAEADGEEAYYRYDGHWNTLGHAVAARVLTPYVSERLPCAGP